MSRIKTISSWFSPVMGFRSSSVLAAMPRNIAVHLGHARWSILQPRPLQIFANAFEDQADAFSIFFESIWIRIMTSNQISAGSESINCQLFEVWLLEFVC